MLTKSRLKKLAQKASNHKAEFSSGCFYKYSHHFSMHLQGRCTDSRCLVTLGLAVTECVGATDKHTPEIFKDQV